MDREQLNRAAAAAARAESLGNARMGDRPSERRSTTDLSVTQLRRTYKGAIPTASVPAEFRIQRAPVTDGEPETAAFEGFASVTNKPYEMYDFFGPYDEVVAGGAFTETLAQDGLEVPLVLNHDPAKIIAGIGNRFTPLELSEVTSGETTGLLVQAPTLQLRQDRTRAIVTDMELELVNEMSFRFMITEGRWSADFGTFTIRSVDIHRGDVAIVTYGANPYTKGAGLVSSVADADRSRGYGRAGVDRALELFAEADADRDRVVTR
jgi:HK97 family phage prohead protease